MRDQHLPTFSRVVAEAVVVLERGEEVEEEEFIDSSRLVYEGAREVRQAVLVARELVLSDTEEEWEEEVEVSTVVERVEQVEQVEDEFPGISGVSTAREVMEQLPEEEKEKIQEQLEVFRTEKRAFDQEVARWDEQGNEVILLAKDMCAIMLEMTDFTRGRGGLKTTSEVILAAARIGRAGTRLDALARRIAGQCPESTTKQDLLAYLQRIALYCHQLNITSRVKADVQDVQGELVVSGLDSATSLIQAAKNLMGAVVLTVKASYVASTKYRKTLEQQQLAPVVVWRTRVPDMLPLVTREREEEVRAKVRKGTGPRLPSPQRILADYDGGRSHS